MRKGLVGGSSLPGSTSILHDLPAEQDALDFKPYVAALAGIISSPTTCTPLTVGVFGEWGSGKTSLMRMVRKKLPKKFCVAWFDAWKYEREETLWRAFLLQVLRALRDAVPNDDSKDSKKALSDLTDLEVALYRSVDREEAGGVQIDWGKLGAGVGQGAVQVGLSFIPGASMLLDLVKEFKGKLTEDAAKNVVEAIRRERSKIHVEQVQSLEQFQGRFQQLVTDHVLAKKKRLVVFVDDLDRCLPEKAVEVLEAIKLFVDAPGCVFLLGLDEKVIGRWIEIKYREFGLSADTSGNDKPRFVIEGTRYLEKIIQLPFRIPPIERDDMAAFVRGLLRKWPHEECPNVFAEGLGDNPRQVKRTVNVFLLLWELSLRREEKLGGKIKPIRLAKVVAMQHVYPELYGVLKETPRLLGQLEEYYRAEMERTEERTAGGRQKAASPEGEDIGKVEPISPPPVLKDLVSRAAVCRLLTLHPPDMADANFLGLPHEELRLYFTLTRRAEAPQVASAQAARPFFEPRMVRIPAGVFQMGSNAEQVKQAIAAGLSKENVEWEQPQHRVELSEYSIGKYLVTNIEYQAFVKDTGRQPPRNWDGVNYPQERGDHPVVNVSWEDAVAYCKWLGQKTGTNYRLPTEAEWEKAARGTDRRIYPWGDVWDKTKLNCAEAGIGDTTPVGQYSPAGGDSPYGASDMAGNVWEWCADWFNENEYKEREDAIVKDPQGPKEGSSRVLRGGSFIDDHWVARCPVRYWYLPDNRYWNVGFRVVASPF